MREILEKLRQGKISIEEAERLVKLTAIEEVSTIARLDLNRFFRKGIPEIILAEEKNPKDVAKIALTMLKKRGRAILSRVTTEHIDVIKEEMPSNALCQVNEKGKIVVLKKKSFEVKKTGGKVGILTAGTSDIPFAEEAKIVAEEMGCEVTTTYDVGVAGIHRILSPLKNMINKDVDVLIVIAGREGALPSVVASMIDIPIIGVPTSIGYGFGGNGVSALTAMLQACPLGLAVVNIDSGVAAGSMAALIANRTAKFRRN